MKHNESFERPAEVDALVGDASKAKAELGWEAKTHALELAGLMVDADREDVARLLGR